MRAVVASHRRWERDERRRAKEAERAYKAAEKASLVQEATALIERFDAILAQLTSVHQETVEAIRWEKVRDAKRPVHPPQPEPPKPVSRHVSQACEQAVAEHVPGFFEKLFGLKGPKRRLSEAVSEAKAEEDAQEAEQAAAHARALEAWKAACAQTDAAIADWEESVELARRVMAREPAAYGEVVSELEGLMEIRELIPSQTMQFSFTQDMGAVTLRVLADNVVPMEEYRLNAKGGLAKKKMPATRRMEIYEDYVCGAALRVAREVLAAIPIKRMIVHVDTPVLNTSTGNHDMSTILSVLVTQEATRGVNWARTDASDFVGRQLHTMKRVRGKGFQPVERIAEG